MSTTQHIAILFDIDGTLIDTGGAGAASWRLAFDELYGSPAEIEQFTDAGTLDPDVGRKTFVGVLGREPEHKEFSRLLERRLHVRSTFALRTQRDELPCVSLAF
jgi:phosphoglycolate phosphatase